MPISLIQTAALNQELINAVRLIRAGFGQLQNLGGGNDFYHMPLLTLASGFERFMKVILCLRALDIHGEMRGTFEGNKPIPTKKNGHDLKLLLEKIKTDCFLDEYKTNIPVASDDLRYLRSAELADFIQLLSQFGQSARYYYIDVLLGEKPKIEDPESEWRRLEMTILKDRTDLLAHLGTGKASELLRKEISFIVVSRLERFARALARLFTIGKIGAEAKRQTGVIMDFLHLSDNQLGKTIYDPSGCSGHRAD